MSRKINPHFSEFVFKSFACAKAHPSKVNIVIDNKSLNGEISSEVLGGAGEDSFLRHKNYLAVADGVGGWSLHHAGNSSLYSRTLLSRLDFHLKNSKKIDRDLLSKIIKKSHFETNQKNILGSTTLCVCALSGPNLVSLNAGDSGFLHIRKGEVIMRSKQQTLGFNCPNQLGPVETDSLPLDSYVNNVLDGDIITLFTDGVSDNLFEKNIIKILEEHSSPKKAAEEILKLSIKIANSKKLTPFEEAARKEHVQYCGGKPDDITVVVGRVKRK